MTMMIMIRVVVAVTMMVHGDDDEDVHRIQAYMQSYTHVPNFDAAL